jgi:hypothetical protein
MYYLHNSSIYKKIPCLCSVSSGKMGGIVRIVDIDGIDGNHCLKTSFHNK